MDVSFSWSPDPGISVATQTYGSSLGSAVMVTDLFLVPSALITSLEFIISSFNEDRCKKRVILGKYPETEHVMLTAEDDMRLQPLADSSASSYLHSSMAGNGVFGGSRRTQVAIYVNI